MYFVKEGSVVIFLESTGTVLARLNGKSSFGEIGFFTGTRVACARTSEFSDLFVIQRTDFLKLVSKFPKDKEKFNFIKDSLALYREFAVINLTCYICQTEGHIATECPVVTAVGDRTASIYLLYTVYRTFATTFRRRATRRTNAWKSWADCLASVKKVKGSFISDQVNVESDGERYLSL